MYSSKPWIRQSVNPKPPVVWPWPPPWPRCFHHTAMDFSLHRRLWRAARPSSKFSSFTQATSGWLQSAAARSFPRPRIIQTQTWSCTCKIYRRRGRTAANALVGSPMWRPWDSVRSKYLQARNWVDGVYWVVICYLLFTFVTWNNLLLWIIKSSIHSKNNIIANNKKQHSPFIQKKKCFHNYTH